MSFATRQYEVFVILGYLEAEPAWTEPRWCRIAATLDPLISKARGSAGVRSVQFRAGPGSPNNRAISFGRIGWSTQGHGKWVHPSGHAADTPFFISTEVWAPSPKACERDGQPPDVYVAVRNARSVPEEQVTFNPIFLLAVAVGLEVSAKPAAETLAALLGALVRARCVRPWGFRFGEAAFTNAIGDLCTTGLFKLGPRNQRQPSLEMLEGSWEAF
jgi:hypothetical protein